MSKIVVNDVSGLLAAVKTAADGDVILLNSGSYRSVNLSGIQINGNVTIKSIDVTNQATFLDLTVKGASGLTFQDIKFAPQSVDRMYTFNVTNSSNIHFAGIEVFGPAGDAGYKSSPFMIRGSENVTVENSEFHHLWHGVSILDNSNVKMTGNFFHDIRTDGIRGGGTSNLVISGNYMTDFHPAVGDHPDGIQLWTTNTTTSAHDIVISDNIITRGSGSPIQGIFIRDQVGTLPYKNVAITGNLVLGGMYNGIAAGHLDGAMVSGNSVIALSGQKSWIGLTSTTNGIVQNNVATTYNFSTSNVDLVKINNSTVAVPSDGGSAITAAWLQQHQASLMNLGGLLTEVLNLSSGVPTVEKPVAELSPPLQEAPAPAPTNVAEPIQVPNTVTHSTINGTAAAETLKVATSGDSDILAGGGDDTIHGGSGNNKLYGGAGNDIYHVKGSGDSVIELAGQGNDTVYAYVDYKLGDNVETLRMAKAGLMGEGNSLDNRIIGSAGADTLYGHDGNDTIQGEAGADIIFGGVGDDKLLGGDGHDSIYGGAGADTLSGGAGNDLLDGGAGNDIIEGGGGIDVLTGGVGADTFIFRSAASVGDTIITDFNSGSKDKIGLSLIDANTKTAANDTFKFIGTSEFTKVAGQLRYQVLDGDSHVSGDINGDGVADFTILLQHVDTLRAGDFIL